MRILNITYQSVREKSIQGRYITNEDIYPFLKRVSDEFTTEILGESVKKRPVRLITLGTGTFKVLMWSQMHGNESTTTKAVFDLINFLSGNNDHAKNILASCTIKIVPILNPDGASAYTRENANFIDLNRDAMELSQPESRMLRQLYEDFKPDYCFNLHDQRTIYNVGKSSKPATISFLAPAHDINRSISETRAISMQLIVAMRKTIQSMIPNQIGRYDDAFNPNCIGDTFQMLNTPTLLFEAGHFPDDYQREKTREYIFYSLITALHTISNEEITAYSADDYFSIPENKKLFFDVLIKNVHKINTKYEQGHNVGILFKEELERQSIIFRPYVEATGELTKYFGHKTYNCLDAEDLKHLKNDNTIYSLLV